MDLKVLTVVGARPQFVKAAAVSRVLRKRHKEVLVHTGQHYDPNLSAVFFDELDIPLPDYNLEVGSGEHGAQTAAMLRGLEEILLGEKPDWVLIYGDTNSTLAGALAAAKLQIPVAHVEAGLRSFNRFMPEEINRIVSDRLSRLLFCPSRTAVEHLVREGITEGVHEVGDVMRAALEFALCRARERSSILEQLNVRAGGYLLATIHRAENTDDPVRLKSIFSALEELAQKEAVIFPMHPRTRHTCKRLGIEEGGRVRWMDPVGYLDMVRLEESARMILTDSGGVQKEAYWLKVPCVTLRDETEWVETVEQGWNVLAGADRIKILNTASTHIPPAHHPDLYGDAYAAGRVVELLTDVNA